MYSREYKNCAIVKKLLGIFFTNQPSWAAIDGQDVTPFSSYWNIFQDTWQKFSRCVNKLLMADTWRIMAWQKDELSMTANVDRLGRGCSFVQGLLAKIRSLHNGHHPWEKKWPWPPSNNSKSFFKRSESMCEKKIHASLPQHQPGGLGVWTAMEAARLPPYISTFLFSQKPWFSSILQKRSPFFLMNGSWHLLFAWEWYCGGGINNTTEQKGG
jgi:hypothetical protein